MAQHEFQTCYQYISHPDNQSPAPQSIIAIYIPTVFLYNTKPEYQPNGLSRDYHPPKPGFLCCRIATLALFSVSVPAKRVVARLPSTHLNPHLLRYCSSVCIGGCATTLRPPLVVARLPSPPRQKKSKKLTASTLPHCPCSSDAAPNHPTLFPPRVKYKTTQRLLAITAAAEVLPLLNLTELLALFSHHITLPA
jgi:hypothetical protein